MSATTERRTWAHKPDDRYMVLATSVIGSPENGFEFVHNLDRTIFPTASKAWWYGLRHLARSDDFNVIVVRHGKVEARLWGNDGLILDTMHSAPERMGEIQRELG